MIASWLISSMFQDFIKKVSDCWEVLESHFVSQLRAKIMQYKVELNYIKKRGMLMSDYIQKIQTLVSQLGSFGSIVSEEDQILAIFNGLDGDYDFVTATMQKGGISFQEFTHKLFT